ncbi:MAG: hypothetical protein MI863_06195 [Desulfobacterales bacterium]|nr:hypothetical protein [Desulfobacterales bacterium]
MTLYWTSVEFDILNPAAWEDCVGGFVYLFFNARDVQDAVPKIKAAVEAEDLRVNLIEFVTPYEGIPWDSEEDQAQYDALAAEAASGDQIIWDEISAYESKD